MSGIADALIGLFFEVTPNLGHSKHYFSYVEKLRPELVKHSLLMRHFHYFRSEVVSELILLTGNSGVQRPAENFGSLPP